MSDKIPIIENLSGKQVMVRGFRFDEDSYPEYHLFDTIQFIWYVAEYEDADEPERFEVFAANKKEIGVFTREELNILLTEGYVTIPALRSHSGGKAEVYIERKNYTSINLR